MSPALYHQDVDAAFSAVGSCQASELSGRLASSALGRDMWPMMVEQQYLANHWTPTHPTPEHFSVFADCTVRRCVGTSQYFLTQLRVAQQTCLLLENKHNWWQIVKHYCDANWISVPHFLMETGSTLKNTAMNTQYSLTGIKIEIPYTTKTLKILDCMLASPKTKLQL